MEQARAGGPRGPGPRQNNRIGWLNHTHHHLGINTPERSRPPTMTTEAPEIPTPDRERLIQAAIEGISCCSTLHLGLTI